jgi:penicillin G amidase
VEEWVAALGEYAKTALRPVDGRVTLPGLREDAEIFTDRWGVPHVYARNLDDMYFAQGWLIAAERMWQVDFTRRLAQGRLAEIVGEPGLPTDRFFRTIGLWRIARKLKDKIDDQSARIASAYHAGFLAAARSLPKPIEYQILGLEPEFSDDLGDAYVDGMCVGLLQAFVLSTNWPFELIRAEIARRLGPEVMRTLAPFTGAEAPIAVPQSPAFPSVVRQLTEAARNCGAARAGLGSNNWVISGAKSVTGKPLLANDPHLSVQMPAIWYEIHLCSPGLEVAGVTIPGIAGVIIGHNRQIAWGFTNSWADVEDLYLERLSEDGTRYEYKGKWHPVRRVREKIFVRGEAKPRIHEVRLTRHGPLLTDMIAGTSDPHVVEGFIKDPLALRWIHADKPVPQSAIQALNRASNWEKFRAAAEQWPSAGQNMVYADVDGHIGYQYTGTVPIRARGSGAAPLPGWTGQHEWIGTIPFEELPSVLNPPQGFLATANHRVADLDYPHYLTNDYEPPERIRRIVQLLTEKERLSSDDYARMHSDTHSGVAEDLVPLFLRAHVTDGREAEAFKYVETWDRRLEADSVGGAVFNVWLYSLSEMLFREKLGGDLFDLYHRLKSLGLAWAYDALRDILRNPEARWVGGDGNDNAGARDALLGRALVRACEDLEARFGPDVSTWRWGRLHQIFFRHAIARAAPPLDELMSAGPYEAPGGDDTLNRGVFTPGEDYADGAVAGWRQIIDLEDFDRSLGVITTGQSGNPASPHHHDQCDLWLHGKYHPLPFSRAAVESAAEGKLTLSPG